jgi:hypothetical protein
MHDSRAAHADATFQRQTSIVDVTAISDGVAAYPGGEAVTAMDRAQAGFNACTTWTSTTNGQTVTFNVSPLSFPKLDDQTLALHLTAQPQGGVLSGVTLAGNLVVIRSGDNLAFLVNVGLPVVDPSLTESLARTQADKLKTL